MNRRDFVRTAGGGVLLAATAAGCGPAVAELEAAWANPGAGERDPRRRWASFAILAPNPHNMQPWLLDFHRPGELLLSIDRERLLPVTDPFNRQIVIGCGAFLELLRMAAAKDGVRAVVESFPEGEPFPTLDARPVARVRFAGAAPADPLFDQVLDRRTIRTAFEDRPIPPDAMDRLIATSRTPGVTADGTLDAARVDALREIAFRGADVEHHTPSAHRESMNLTFVGSREVAEARHGISLVGPQFDAMKAVGLLNREQMMKPGSFAYNSALDFMRSAADTAQGFLWTVTATNTRAEQLAAGASFVRAGLQATADGLALQPWSQTLQEYPTMRPALQAAHRALAPQGGRVQMLARVGYPKAKSVSPRRGLQAHIV